LQVFHVDLCTAAFKYRVFMSVPAATRFSALANLVTGKSAKPVMCQAVADPDSLGYGRLYVMFLECSKQQIAKCFWVLAQASSYPVLVHCIHGYEFLY
jgi:hypothetical protein